MSDLTIGAAMQEIRHARGLTQEALARKADVSLPYIVKLERGARNCMSPAVATRIAESLHVPISFIYALAEIDESDTITAIKTMVREELHGRP